MSGDSIRFAIFGSSLISGHWNGAWAYFRGIVHALHRRGHRITFYEPHAYQRQEHRDIPDPDWAQVVVYEPSDETAVRAVVAGAADHDVIVKATGVGVFDDVLEAAVLELPGDSLKVFWDVDAPATLAAIESGALSELGDLISAYDLVFTRCGGAALCDRYRVLGARTCVAVYEALDPTIHHPVPPRAELACDLLFFDRRLPGREDRVREYFFVAAEVAPECRFVLGGNRWVTVRQPNVRQLGEVSPKAYNVLNCSAKIVLDLARGHALGNGFSPPAQVFEAAGVGACLITDPWPGIDLFLEPDREVLVAADGFDVAALVQSIDHSLAGEIGNAARARIVADHTYDRRAAQVERVLTRTWRATT